MRKVQIGLGPQLHERHVDKSQVFALISADMKRHTHTGTRAFVVRAGTGLGKSTEFMY